MATGTVAIAQKLVSKKSTSATKNGKSTSRSQKKTSAPSKSTSSAPSKSRSDIPWQKIADLYNKGLSVGEISDKLDLTRPKNKKGKENPFPYYLTVGYLTKLSHGVEVDGKEISIVRGAKNKKRAESKEKSKDN